MQIAVPVLVMCLICASLIKGVPVYDSFLRGAEKALPLIVRILPCLAAMLCAVNLFRESGALDFITGFTAPAFEFAGIPRELITLILLRPFSGSAAIALLKDVFSVSGVDSYQGYLASVIVGSSETVLYTVALYFGAVGVKKTRYAVTAAIVSALVGLFASVILSLILYKP